MRLFQVRTKNHNTVTITARSSFHGRKLFAAKHEKTMRLRRRQQDSPRPRRHGAS